MPYRLVDHPNFLKYSTKIDSPDGKYIKISTSTGSAWGVGISSSPTKAIDEADAICKANSKGSPPCTEETGFFSNQQGYYVVAASDYNVGWAFDGQGGSLKDVKERAINVCNRRVPLGSTCEVKFEYANNPIDEKLINPMDDTPRDDLGLWTVIFSSERGFYVAIVDENPRVASYIANKYCNLNATIESKKVSAEEYAKTSKLDVCYGRRYSNIKGYYAIARTGPRVDWGFSPEADKIASESAVYKCFISTSQREWLDPTKCELVDVFDNSKHLIVIAQELAEVLYPGVPSSTSPTAQQAPNEQQPPVEQEADQATTAQ